MSTRPRTRAATRAIIDRYLVEYHANVAEAEALTRGDWVATCAEDYEYQGYLLATLGDRRAVIQREVQLLRDDLAE
jgi:hypothetical protein